VNAVISTLFDVMCDCNQDSDFNKCAGKVMIDEEKKRRFCDKFNDKLVREFAKSFFRRPPSALRHY